MKKPTKMTRSERKEAFKVYINQQVKSAPRYVADLEKGFLEAPVQGYETIYDITDPDLLESPTATRPLRESTVFTRASRGGTAGLAGLNWYIRFLKDSRDSYYEFMNHFNIKPKELFEWGMKAIVFPPKEQVEMEWENLKHRIANNERVIIRGYGRDAKGTNLYLNFYKYLLNNDNIAKDSSNNYKPKANPEKMTGLKRNSDIYNYQVSHIWGRTKNVYLFEAPWNICYTPKIIDPFTGHETKGDLPKEFREYFIEFARKKYKKYIADYNEIISGYDVESILDDYCRRNGIDNNRFRDDVIKELSVIPV